MATHSSILAWRIPGTEDPGRLQSMGLQRVEHNSPSVSRATNTLVAFPGGTSDKEPACQCRRHKRCGFDPWVRKVPCRRKWQSNPVFLLGESHGQRSLAGYKESDMTEAT